LKRDELQTAALSTKTDELSFTPFSFKTTGEDERFEFKFSAGRGLVRSEKLDLLTGRTEKERNSTYAYKLDATYNMGAAKCWSVGLSYEIKTDELFSSTVSSTFGPTFGYNLLCSDDDGSAVRPRVTPLGLFAPE
jgi:hypothetical protein